MLVATVRALKYNGGVAKNELNTENLEALEKGIVNLEKHIENLHKYGVPVVVTLNAFVSDSTDEIAFVKKFCEDRNCDFALSQVWEKGGEGGIELANAVLNTLDTKESHFAPIYDNALPIADKIKCVAKEIYGAADVVFAPAAMKQMESLGILGLEVCQSVWQKTSIHFLMTPHFSEGRKALP